MGAGKNILLVFLSILFVLSTIFSIYAWSLHILIYPDVYENAFEKNNVYQQIYEKFLGGKDIGGGLVDLSSEGIKRNVNSIIEGVLAYARGREDSGVYLDINNQTLHNFFINNVEKVRVCNAGEISFQGKEVLCRPSNKSSAEFVNEVLADRNMSGILAIDKVNLLDTFDKDKKIDKLRDAVHKYNQILYGLILFSVVLLVIIFIFGGFRWSGINLLFSGLIAYFSSSSLVNFIESKIDLTGDYSFLKVASLDIVNPILSRIEIIGIVIGVIGIILFAIAFFFKSKKSKDSGNK